MWLWAGVYWTGTVYKYKKQNIVYLEFFTRIKEKQEEKNLCHALSGVQNSLYELRLNIFLRRLF